MKNKKYKNQNQKKKKWKNNSLTPKDQNFNRIPNPVCPNLIECSFDGSCSPRNPGGVMGIGCIIKLNGKIIKTHSQRFRKHPSNTNNVAEALALMYIFSFLVKSGYNANEDYRIIISGDSSTVLGKFPYKRPCTAKGAYAPFINECLRISKKYFMDAIVKRRLTFLWVQRFLNSDADLLSMDENKPISELPEMFRFFHGLKAELPAYEAAPLPIETIKKIYHHSEN